MFTPTETGQSTPRLREVAGQFLHMLAKPQGIFFGVTSPVGSAFGIVPWKVTQQINESNLRNLQPASLRSVTFFGSSAPAATLPPIPTPFGLSTPTVNIVGTSKVGGKDDAGVGITVPVPTPIGKMAAFFNIRQDQLTQKQLDALLAGRMPREDATVSGNFGVMYAVSDGLIRAVSVSNPALGESLRLAKDAAGVEPLWVGVGWNAKMNFTNGELGAVWVNDVQIPLGDLPAVLAQAQLQMSDFANSVVDAHGQLQVQGGSSIAAGGELLSPGVASSSPAEQDFWAGLGRGLIAPDLSPWDWVRTTLNVDVYGQPLLIDGALSFRPSADPANTLAAQVYRLGVQQGLLSPSDVIADNAQAARIVDQGIADARVRSGDALEEVLARLLNPYGVDHGSDQLQAAHALYFSGGTGRDGWPAFSPQRIDALRESLGLPALRDNAKQPVIPTDRGRVQEAFRP